jgi:hypothetical protein
LYGRYASIVKTENGSGYAGSRGIGPAIAKRFASDCAKLQSPIYLNCTFNYEHQNPLY